MLSAQRPRLLAALAFFAMATAGLAGAQDASTGCNLCRPAFDGDLARVELLLEHGADVNAHQAGDVIAPLGWALANDHFDVALLLVKHGARVETLIARKEYLTPLADAALGGDLGLVSALLKAGADVNSQTGGGHSSALTWATQSSNHSAQNAAVIQMLLEAGADPNKVSDAGLTPLDDLCAAAGSASPDALPLIKTLLAYGAKADDSRAMKDALGLADRGDPMLLTLLLAYGARVDPKDSAAILDAVRGRPELIPGLIDAGVTVDQEGADGDTALNVALRAADVASVEQLLAVGADPNLEGVLGPPYSQLVRFNPPDPEMVRAVMAAGADLGTLFYDEPKGQVATSGSAVSRSAPSWSNDELNRALFPGFSADSQNLLDRLFRERYMVLSGMSRYFAPPRNTRDIHAFLYPNDTHPVLGAPAPGSIPLSEFEDWLAAGPDYLAAPNAQAAFFAASKGLTTLPAIPQAAREHEAAGRALYAKAVNPTGALAAAAEYEAAARLAPWVGAYHRNLCVLYDLGGALLRAYEHCVIYESGAPADLEQLKQRSDEIADQLKSMDATQAELMGR